MVPLLLLGFDVFKDNTAMHLVISSQSGSQMIKRDLLNLKQWELVGDMNFNPSKCQVLQVTILKETTSKLSTFFILHDWKVFLTVKINILGLQFLMNYLGAPIKIIHCITEQANLTLGSIKKE